MTEDQAALKPTIKSYRQHFETFTALPATGRDREEVLAEMREMTDLEAGRWRDGYASGSVYNGDEEHIDFLNRVYAINSQSNPLHTDLWPSAVKYESEIVAMTANMLGATEAGAPQALLRASAAASPPAAPRASCWR